MQIIHYFVFTLTLKSESRTLSQNFFGPGGQVQTTDLGGRRLGDRGAHFHPEPRGCCPRHVHGAMDSLGKDGFVKIKQLGRGAFGEAFLYQRLIVSSSSDPHHVPV